MDQLKDDRLTLVGLLFESSSALRTQLDHRLSEDVDLPLQWFELLIRLARSPGRHLRMSDLAAPDRADAQRADPGDRPPRRRCARRAGPCPDDGRGRSPRSPPRGTTHHPRSGATPRARRRGVHQRLDADERVQLLVLLHKVRDHVNPAAAAPPPRRWRRPPIRGERARRACAIAADSGAAVRRLSGVGHRGEAADLDQLEPERLDAAQQPVQRRLVLDGAAQHRLDGLDVGREELFELRRQVRLNRPRTRTS